jgi:Zn-dependent protease with chaperone function
VFFALCICLLFAVMFLSIALATFAILPAVRLANRFADRADSSGMANILFVLRAFPILLGAVASLGLALPAFLEFEPHTTHEIPGAPLLVFAGAGIAFMAVMSVRCILAMRATRRVRGKWLEDARLLPDAKTHIPVYCVERAASLLAVTGIFSPRIFVSRDVVDNLTPAELDAALSHEMAHVSATDNLKQLFLKVTSPPHWLHSLAKVDFHWARFAELAADERAMTSGASALELASALVKVGRLSVGRRPALLTASHLVDGCAESTMGRVARLRDLLERENEQPQASTASRHHLAMLLWVGSLLMMYLLLLGTILPQIHEALEFLVR